MSKKATGVQSSKKVKREAERKKTRNRKIIIASAIGLVIVLAIAAYIVLTTMQNAGAEIYTDGTQTVTLRQNGSFTAELVHDIRYTGTYTITEDDTWTIVTFTHNGNSVESELISDQLYLPDEWVAACGHGHSYILAKS